jgi:selenide,water dikinase
MHDFKVTEGFSAETSGGILTMMPPDRARDFIKASLGEYGQTVWVVGSVTKGSRKAILREDS